MTSAEEGAWFLVQHSSGFRFVLPQTMIFVGREECDITLQSRSVDKRHAVITFDYYEKRFKVKDLNSSNGTYVNEARIPEQTYVKLDNMDNLRFGYDSFVYTVQRNPATNEAKPGPDAEITSPTESISSTSEAVSQMNGSTPSQESNPSTSSPDPVSSSNQSVALNPAACGTSEPDAILPDRDVATALTNHPALSGSLSNTSLHSAFSEDSLTAGGSKGSHTPLVTENASPTTQPVLTEPPQQHCDEWEPDKLVPNEIFSADSLLASVSSSAVSGEVEQKPPDPSLESPEWCQQQMLLPSQPDATLQKDMPNKIDPGFLPADARKERSSAEDEASGSAKPLQPMAFTIDFGVKEKANEGLLGRKLDIGDSISKFAPRHRRNLSLTKVEEHKPKEETNSPRISHSPIPSRKTTRRTGYHSEGYFSSDQEDEASSRSESAHRSRLEGERAARSPYVESKKTAPIKSPPPPIKLPQASKSTAAAMKSPPATTKSPPAALKSPPAAIKSPPGFDRRNGAAGFFGATLEESASYLFNKVLSVSGEAKKKLKQQTTDSVSVQKTKIVSQTVVCNGRETKGAVTKRPSQEEAHEDVRNGFESPKDNVSDTGTYTIDKDGSCPDEDKARQEIDHVFGVDDHVVEPSGVVSNGRHPVNKVGSSRDSPNWIKEWAAQVAEQNQQRVMSVTSSVMSQETRIKASTMSPQKSPSPPVLSPATSQSISASVSAGWSSSSQESHPRQRRRLPTPPVNQTPFSYSAPKVITPLEEVRSPTKTKVPVEMVAHDIVRGNDHHSDGSLETESFLKDTESVVTAMQARMSQSLTGSLNLGGGSSDASHDSGGDSDVDTSNSYPIPVGRSGSCTSLGAVANGKAGVGKSLSVQLRSKLRQLEESMKSKEVTTQGRKQPMATVKSRALARLECAGDGFQNAEDRSGHSDSSSETCDSKVKSREVPTSNAAESPLTTTRYNRAFSLRRARLGCEDAATPPSDNKRKPPPSSSARLKKTLDAKQSSAQNVPGKSSLSPNFSRADGGRFSLRVSKGNAAAAQPPAPTVPKSKPAPTTPRKDGRKSAPSHGGAGGRSNSTLSSREMEFQNWKRRKNYDPMKAAAEGRKKKDPPKKPPSSNRPPTQTSPSASATSRTPSPPNPILRSASFHGTGGPPRPLLGSCTSEDELTLSADEEFVSSPRTRVTRVPAHLPSPSPADLPASPARKASLEDSLLDGSKGFVRNTTPNSSLRGRAKMEALDNLVIAALHGISTKLKGNSYHLLRKLRVLYEEDCERAALISEVLAQLEDSEAALSSPSKSPYKELSSTLKNMKRLESVFVVLDQVIFGDEDLELEGSEELDGDYDGLPLDQSC